MDVNKYSEFLKTGMEKFGGKIPLSDAELEGVSGGVGGANEATCPQCGKPMSSSGGQFGDPTWYCAGCNIHQAFSDADTIQMIQAMEAANYPNIIYPVWWKQLFP